MTAETIFGWCVVNTVTATMNVNLEDMSRASAEARIISSRAADLERARKLPKGSDLAAAMRRRAESYRLAKIVSVPE